MKHKLKQMTILAAVALLLFSACSSPDPTGEVTLAEDEEISSQETEEGPAEEEAAEDDVQEESASYITMVFSGDIMLGDAVLAAYDSYGISGVLDETLLSEMTGADLCVINEEFPFGTGGTAADKTYTFRVDPSYVSVLTDLGADIVSLANNHTLDYGTDVLLQTFETLDEVQIAYVGAGESLEEASAWETYEQDGRTIAVIAASRVIPTTSWDVRNQTPGVFTTYDPEILIEQIEAASEECDFVAVYVHWGVEREEYPEDYERELAKQYIDAGADLVVGSHPHVLQGIEFYNGVPIIYSLGNYIFYSTIEETALLKAVWDSEGDLSLQIIPASAESAKTSVMSEDEGAELLEYIEEISVNVQIDAEGYITQTAE